MAGCLQTEPMQRVLDRSADAVAMDVRTGVASDRRGGERSGGADGFEDLHVEGGLEHAAHFAHLFEGALAGEAGAGLHSDGEGQKVPGVAGLLPNGQNIDFL